ncbi:lipopolysaccharide biosynthesis protein [Paraburkholderia nodosa]|uniref:lipopolysaccharide biosynthesis protein n=1 Tax=Paraburkholderia nodosa TaxID=392320 RepID=UPI0012B689F4|nr:polysaccharide biosynthesis protein [Paraburkholderia nodosa]
MHLISRLGLRIAALSLKFALTVVIARALGLAAVGDYGLALAVSVVASKLLGLGFSTEINRRLSLANSRDSVLEAYRLLFVFGGFYAAIAAIMTLLEVGGILDGFWHVRPAIVWGVTLVALSEHAGLEANSWIFSMHRPHLGAVLLFVRSGAWAAIAIAGLITKVIDSVELILLLWGVTNVLVVAVVIRILVDARRQSSGPISAGEPARLGKMRSLWIGGAPFFVATTALSCLQYSERFIAGMVVSSVALGSYVFCWSISNAIQTIAYATVVVTSGPRMVRALDVSYEAFRTELRRSVFASLGLSVFGAAALLLAWRFIFRIAHQADGANEFAILGVLLLSFVFRSIADIYWGGAIALRLGKQVAVLVSLVMLLVFAAGWMLVTRFGILGAAWAHLLSSVGIFVLLLWQVGHAVEGYRRDATTIKERHAS